MERTQLAGRAAGRGPYRTHGSRPCSRRCDHSADCRGACRSASPGSGAGLSQARCGDPVDRRCDQRRPSARRSGDDLGRALHQRSGDRALWTGWLRAADCPRELLRARSACVDHEAVRPRHMDCARREDVVSGPLILGIESSCDETGVGLVRGHELLANEVASSVELHIRYGGVVPEIASRAHLEALVPTLNRASEAADVDLTERDGIAVTAGPGLMGALVVGLAGAKALAYALDKPLYGVNHLAGHVAVDVLEHGPLPEPCVALLVSGGHTSLLLVEEMSSKIIELGSTVDDAAGEAYDKVARV